MKEENPRHPKQLKPKITFQLLDWNGVLVRDGDHVQVFIPGFDFEDYGTRPALVLTGIIGATLSKGLHLRVLKCEQPEGGPKYVPPKVWELKYCKHKFVKQ